MNTKTMGWIVGLGALASSLISCSQSRVQCTVGHAGGLPAGYATKFYPKTSPLPACGVAGDQIGFETYHPPGGGDNGKQPDFTKPAIVAFQSDALGSLETAKEGAVDEMGNPKPAVDADTTHKLFSLGTFSSVEPDENDFCAVSAPSAAEQHFPAVPKFDDPTDPALSQAAADEVSVKYEWSNVKVYVTAAAQGTQFSADLHYTNTDITTQTTCTADYTVAGVWPAVGCAGEDDMGNVIAVESFCCPNADPAGGRMFGSGINPDFPMKCDPKLLLCVLDIADPGKLPALSPGWADKAKACKLTAATTADK